MTKPRRKLVHHEELNVDAYELEEYEKPFPPHTHNYYVIGIEQEGARKVLVNGREYLFKPGNVMLLNPDDSHSCAQQSSAAVFYRAINIPCSAMGKLLASSRSESLTLPRFAPNIVNNPEAYQQTAQTIDAILQRSTHSEEKLDSLLRMLSSRYAGGNALTTSKRNNEAEICEEACSYLKAHCTERIEISELCRKLNISSSSLLRAFTQVHGITPYRYLESVRIEKAKELLRQGIPTASVALQAGFADQSHLTRAFSATIGIPPSSYQKMLNK